MECEQCKIIHDYKYCSQKCGGLGVSKPGYKWVTDENISIKVIGEIPEGFRAGIKKK